MNEISVWNGYPVHGDVKELDRIVESEGFINLEKDDIITVLSAAGESYVASGVNANLGEAFNEAVKKLPCEIDKVGTLLIEFRYGSKQPIMSEFTAIHIALCDACTNIEVVWGVASDKSLGESNKVVLLASVKA